MDTSIIKEYQAKLNDLVETGFETSLLESSLKNLLDKGNQLRFNNFACGIRELSRHVLTRLAPLEEVEKCLWYKNETKLVGKLSRAEKIKYAFQAGLPDNFIITFFEIQDYKDHVLEAINILNKYTHVNEDTFNISESEVLSLSGIVVDAFENLITGIRECRENIKLKIEETITDAVMNHSISQSFDEIDILSTHHSIESLWVENFHIEEMTGDSLHIIAEGSVDVNQQFGSNSDVANGIGTEFESSFPFSSKLIMEISNTFPKDDIEVDSFVINTDSWYE